MEVFTVFSAKKTIENCLLHLVIMRALNTWTIEKASLQRTCRKNLKTRVLYLIKYKTSAKIKMNTEMITNSRSIGLPWRSSG